MRRSTPTKEPNEIVQEEPKQRGSGENRQSISSGEKERRQVGNLVVSNRNGEKLQPWQN